MPENPPNPEPAPAPPAILVLTARGTRVHRPADTIRTYDFRQSGFLAPSELRRIRQRHEQFVRSLAARLAIFLRLEFTVQLAKLQIVGYQKFIEHLPTTHITLFKVDPLKGVGLLEIPPRLSLSLVDRMLGGPGKAPDAARELSEIEVALVEQVADALRERMERPLARDARLAPGISGPRKQQPLSPNRPPIPPCWC